MANIIKIKRGAKANLPILARGELAYATDTNELFIGVLAEPTLVTDNVLINDLPDLSAYYTKSEIEALAGLGIVWNSNTDKFDADLATQGEAEAGTDNTKLMTPLLTKEAIDAQTGTILTNADYVAFSDLAAKEDAEDGTLNDVWMSPLRTAQAIAELAPTPVIATQEEAEAGSINNKFMTPLRTAQAIAELAGESGGTGSANVTNYEVVINASDTWARDQITVVETEDFNAEGVSGDGVHAVNDDTHIYRYGINESTSTTVNYDLPNNSTEFNTPSTPIILTFESVDNTNNLIVFESSPDWTTFFNFNEIIYIQFANLPEISSITTSYGIQLGNSIFGVVSFSYGGGSVDNHRVQDLINKGLWNENAAIAIRVTDTGPMAFTYFKDGSGITPMTIINEEFSAITVLQKINKETLVQEQETILPEENLYEVFNIAVDSTHVYILTGDIDDVYEVQKYLKSDLSFVAKEPLADLKLAIAQDDDYLYIGGVESGIYVPDGVEIYRKEELDTNIKTSAYGSVIESIYVDNDYVYAAGGDYDTFSHPISIWDKNDKDLIALNKLPDPATLPAGNSESTAFSNDGTYLAVAHSTSPFITIYKRSGDTFTKLTNPATLPAGRGRGTSFSADGTYLAVAHDLSPFITIYKRSGDTFTKLTDPATLPASNGNDTAFSTDGTYLAVAHATSPFITIYKRSGDTFTKLTDPATLPASNGNDTAFSTDGTYLAVAHSLSPFITIYKRSGDTFTKLANPATLPTEFGQGVAFSPDGTYLAVAHADTPFITIYKRSGDTFTKLTNPATLPTGIGRGTAFSTDGTYLAVAHDVSPFITIYKRSGDTFTKLANPATLPPFDANGTAFSPEGNYLAVGYRFIAPFITIYKNNYELEFIGNTPDYPGILKSVIADDNFIYAAGEKDPIADSIIVKYSKETLEIVGTSVAVGGAVDKLEQDLDFIYALSIDAETIKQYAKSDLSLISTLTIDNMQSFTQDTDFIYSFEALLGELSKSTKGSLSYNLTKAVSGITAEDDPIVDIDLSTNKFSDVVPIQEAWGLVYRLDTLEDEVKLYATEEPEFPANTTVKLKVVK